MESPVIGSGSTGAAAEEDAAGGAQQQAAAGAISMGGGSGGGCGTAPIAGSLYEAVLLELLRGLRTGLPLSDRTLVRLLAEAPLLPMPSVVQHLQQLCSDGPDWATLALLAARDVILQRPPNRPQVLNWVLEVAVSSDEDARGKAVRLVANRLFPEVSMSQQIEIYAQQQLDMLLVEQQSLTAEAVKKEQQQEQKCTTGAAAAALDTASPHDAGPSEERAAQLCGLYCALCTKKHSLLRRLLEVYSHTSEGGRAAIRRNAGGLAKTLGATAPALLAVVADPPPGSLPLLLDMLHVLTDTAVPPQPLVAACLAVHASSRDPRTLVPALPGMDKAAVLRLLPSLLELPPEALRRALARLVAPLPALEEGNAADAPLPGVAPFSPVEILTTLHTLDVSREPGLLRRVMQGVTVCLSSPAFFPPEALAATINGLLIRVPLPQVWSSD